MPLWGGDSANTVPKFVGDLVSSGSGNAAKKAVASALYQNTTPNAVVKNQTVSLIYFNTADIQRANPKPGGAPGWYLKRKGSGNRANRVAYECLVATAGQLPILPSGYYFITDTDGTLLVDSDGAYLIGN